jgi:hypothetical protein
MPDPTPDKAGLVSPRAGLAPRAILDNVSMMCYNQSNTRE